jgi:hypothetical protein
VPLGTPVTITLNAANGSDPASPFNGRYSRVSPGDSVFYGDYYIAGTGYAYKFETGYSTGYIILGPGTSYIIINSGTIYPATGFWTLIFVHPDDGINAELVSANISTDANNVPRTGWDAGLVPPVSITTP